MNSDPKTERPPAEPGAGGQMRAANLQRDDVRDDALVAWLAERDSNGYSAGIGTLLDEIPKARNKEDSIQGSDDSAVCETTDAVLATFVRGLSL